MWHKVIEYSLSMVHVLAGIITGCLLIQFQTKL